MGITNENYLSKLFINEVKNAGGGGGGASSWDDLTDKPFGEAHESIVFDGNTEGRDCTATHGMFSWVKVSDEIFTKEQLLGGVGTIDNPYFDPMEITEVSFYEYNGSLSVTYPPDNTMVGNVAGFVVIPKFEGESFRVEMKDGNSVDFPSSGLYFINAGFGITLDFPVKKLDEKFIPNVGLTEDEVQALIDAAIGDAIGGSY